MTGLGEFSVIVQELGPSNFSWALVKRQSSSALGEYLAVSSNHFPDYDQALDAGFVALQEFCTKTARLED